MSTKQPKRILIAPLDWGLGHTTRCIPIIRHILYQGHVPVFAGNENQRTFIKETFGSIENIHLDGYNVSYSGDVLSFLKQIPGIMKTIKTENNWLQQIASKLNIDGIISDNRYGLFHLSIPSVIITHQLMVHSGMGRSIDLLIQKIHYYYLNKFTCVWVVDKLNNNLAGNLTKTKKLPRKAKYIGLLSQFEGMKLVNKSSKHLLILLSGPEPQRTILSDILWQQLENYQDKIIFIEGKQNSYRNHKSNQDNIYHFDRLTHEKLVGLIADAKLIICRSGYSTIMDLVAIGKKAILIPTPGQPEQQYLADSLSKRGLFYSAKQKSINLIQSIEEEKMFKYNFLRFADDFMIYKEVLEDWIKGL